MSAWIYFPLAVLLVLACAACWLANLFSLPGNWGIVALAAAFAYLVPATDGRGVTGATVWWLVGLGVAGEAIEFAAGAAGAARQGASRRALWLSLAGAVAGSVVGAAAGLPVPVIGSLAAAVAGSAAGAFAGAYLGEAWARRDAETSLRVAQAAAAGRVLGTIGKLAVSTVMLTLTAADALIAW